MPRVLLAAGWILAFSMGGRAQIPAERDDTRQVLWQRSLDDALALSQSTGRPLLVAVNTDAESASERIVGEVYRDARFVAASRAFVCLVASPLRHTARDHDGRGARVVDPRFGEVTSGEAVALEPLVFERFLGGERIAPRHALVRDPAGAAGKLFDLFQLYDFERLVAALEREAAALGGAIRLEPEFEFDAFAEPAGRAARWAELAGARSARNRAQLESALARAPAAQLAEALAAIAERGDAGALDALRVVAARAALEGRELQTRLGDCALYLDLGGPLAYALWEQVLRLDARAGQAGLAREALLLPLLARLQPELAGMAPTPAIPEPALSALGLRSFLLSCAALGAEGPGLEVEEARAGLGQLLAPETWLETLTAVAAAGGAFDAPSLLRYAARTRPALRAVAPVESLRSEDELIERLAELERRPAGAADGELWLERGRLGLELARVRLAAGAGGADLLLVDALADLEGAIALQPDAVAPRLQAARAAFLLQRFDEQERLALAALAALQRTSAPCAAAHAHDWPALVPQSDLHSEALRWLGDAAARLLPARAGGAPREELPGMLRAGRALSLVAAGAQGDANDWSSLASFWGALGRRREEFAAVREGLARAPGDEALRAALRRVAVVAGRPELALEVSREVAAAAPASASALWYLGFAAYEDGERLRNLQDPGGALERYAEADDAWLESAEGEPAFEPSVRHYRARAALGQGFARLLDGDRGGAAHELARALELAPEVADLRDALDREALDLLDGVLEWRSGGASPVAALELGTRLAELDPDGARWLAAVADSELREALRAVGRDAPEADIGLYLERAAQAARLALQRAPGDPAAERALGQALTVAAERELAGGAPDPARMAALLDEAARVLGQEPAAQGVGSQALAELCAVLREQLGEAAPVTRPGR